MALRVLLADESDTIKKVFQLSLQEYKPEIKAVQSGLDVLDVCISFQPDIIFADVLLQKRNGYDVCTELKKHPELSKIPVVLMWSSFMELDHIQFKKSGANEQLEKPFDGDHLKDLIKQLAPQAKEKNPISSFLQYPKAKAKLPEAPSSEENSIFNGTLEQPTALNHMGEHTQHNVLGTLNFGATEVNDGRRKTVPTAPPPDDNWKSKDLSKFKINKEAEADNLDKFEALNINTPKKRASEILDDRTIVADVSRTNLPSLEDNEIPTSPVPRGSKETPAGITMRNPGTASTAPAPVTASYTSPAPRVEEPSRRQETATRAPAPTAPSISQVEVEAIVRAHTEEFLKTQIKPAMASIIEKVIREELNKLLEEEVRLNKELDR